MHDILMQIPLKENLWNLYVRNRFQTEMHRVVLPEIEIMTGYKHSDKHFKALLKKVVIAPFVFLIRFYQVCISPLKGGPSCRFTPTCSQYALEAFRRHGPFKGFYLSLRRILRCHPWGGHGYDPVP